MRSVTNVQCDNRERRKKRTKREKIIRTLLGIVTFVTDWLSTTSDQGKQAKKKCTETKSPSRIRTHVLWIRHGTVTFDSLSGAHVERHAPVIHRDGHSCIVERVFGSVTNVTTRDKSFGPSVVAGSLSSQSGASVELSVSRSPGQAATPSSGA